LINAAEAAAAAERQRQQREALVVYFQERMQIQRSLIELQAQAVQNEAEIGRRQVAVARWAQGQRDLEAAAAEEAGAAFDRGWWCACDPATVVRDG
jgi:hypothetical protein